MELKENLKRYRIERKITQNELAKALNTTLKTVSHWETGYTEPSVCQLISIADFYKVSLDDLVGRNFVF